MDDYNHPWGGLLSFILSIGVIHTKGLRDVIYTPLTIHTSLVVT